MCSPQSAWTWRQDQQQQNGEEKIGSTMQHCWQRMLTPGDFFATVNLPLLERGFCEIDGTALVLGHTARITCMLYAGADLDICWTAVLILYC